MQIVESSSGNQIFVEDLDAFMVSGVSEDLTNFADEEESKDENPLDKT